MSLDLDKLLGEETVSEADSKETATTLPVEKAEKKAPTTTKKKKGKPRGGNSPVIGTNGLNLEPGDNAKFLNINLELMNMPSIDMENAEEVQKRLSEYFELYGRYDVKPTVVGMAIALNGHSRQWLWAVTHDAPLGGKGNVNTLPPEVTNTIKKAYFLLESLWENYMNSGKVNPVAGIFLGKNNYGYQDKTEYVLTPNQRTDNDYNADEIRERYIAADQQHRLTTSESSDEDTND